MFLYWGNDFRVMFLKECRLLIKGLKILRPRKTGTLLDTLPTYSPLQEHSGLGLKFPSKGLDLSTGRFGYHIWETHLQTFLSWSNCQSAAQVLMLAVVLLAFTEGLQWDEVGKHYEHPKLINAHTHTYICIIYI